jgi:hypothetical protein
MSHYCVFCFMYYLWWIVVIMYYCFYELQLVIFVVVYGVCVLPIDR